MKTLAQLERQKSSVPTSLSRVVQAACRTGAYITAMSLVDPVVTTVSSYAGLPEWLVRGGVGTAAMLGMQWAEKQLYATTSLGTPPADIPQQLATQSSPASRFAKTVIGVTTFKMVLQQLGVPPDIQRVFFTMITALKATHHDVAGTIGVQFVPAFEAAVAALLALSSEHLELFLSQLGMDRHIKPEVLQQHLQKPGMMRRIESLFTGNITHLLTGRDLNGAVSFTDQLLADRCRSYVNCRQLGVVTPDGLLDQFVLVRQSQGGTFDSNQFAAMWEGAKTFITNITNASKGQLHQHNASGQIVWWSAPCRKEDVSMYFGTQANFSDPFITAWRNAYPDYCNTQSNTPAGSSAPTASSNGGAIGGVIALLLIGCCCGIVALHCYKGRFRGSGGPQRPQLRTVPDKTFPDISPPQYRNKVPVPINPYDKPVYPLAPKVPRHTGLRPQLPSPPPEFVAQLQAKHATKVMPVSPPKKQQAVPISYKPELPNLPSKLSRVEFYLQQKAAKDAAKKH